MTESRPWGAAKEKPKEEEGATYPCAQQHRGAAPARLAKIPFCASPVMREARVRGSPEMAPP